MTFYLARCKYKYKYKYMKLNISNTSTKNLVVDWSLQRAMRQWRITGCRNIKLGQENELSAHVWTCADEEDDIKQTKTTER